MINGIVIYCNDLSPWNAILVIWTATEHWKVIANVLFSYRNVCSIIENEFEFQNINVFLCLTLTCKSVGLAEIFLHNSQLKFIPHCLCGYKANKLITRQRESQILWQNLQWIKIFQKKMAPKTTEWNEINMIHKID